MEDAVSERPNLGIAWYLTAAYLYYECDKVILSDAAFDALSKFLLEVSDTISHHHKHLITTDDLRAGTLLNRKLPKRIVGAACWKYAQLNGEL